MSRLLCIPDTGIIIYDLVEDSLTSDIAAFVDPVRLESSIADMIVEAGVDCSNLWT